MVKRIVLTSFLLVALLVVGLLLAGGYWLLRTPDGARWVLTTVSRVTPVDIEVAELEGALWGELRLQDIEVTWPGGAYSGSHLLLRWQPLDLARLQLRVKELDVGRMHVVWDESSPDPVPQEPVEPLRIHWPQIEGLPLRVAVVIEQVRAAEIAFGARAGQPTLLRDIVLSAAWEQGRLEVQGLDVAGAFGRISGDLGASLVAPQLASRLRWEMPREVAGVDVLLLDMELDAAADLVTAGPLSLQLAAADNLRFSLDGRLELASGGIALSDLILSRAAAPDRVQGRVALDWPESGPRFAAVLELENLDLAPELGQTTRLSGHIDAEGDFQSYRGHIALVNALPEWQDLALKAQVEGDATGLRLDEMELRVLQGVVRGEVLMAWQEGFFLDARLAGRELNPATIAGVPDGDINLDVSGHLQVSAAGELSAAAGGHFLPSTLLEQDFSGQFAAAWEQDDLIVERLELLTQGWQLQVAGRLSERLNYALEVEDFSSLLPELAGSATAQGWLYLRDAQPGGVLTASGDNFAFQDLRIAHWQIAADVPAPDADSRIEAHLAGLRRAELSLREVALLVEGQMDAHRLQLSADWGSGHAAVRAAGGWLEQSWRGTLEEVSGEEKMLGAWRTRRPATLVAGAQAVELSGLVISSAVGGDLLLDGAFVLQAFTGHLEAAWRNFNLEHINPWVSDMQLAGATSGVLEVQIHSPEQLDLYGDMTFFGQLAVEAGIVEVEQGALALAWDRRGLDVQANLAIIDLGRLHLQASSTAPGAPVLPAPGELSLEWQGMDLAALAEHLPVPLDLHGALSGEIQGGWDADLRLNMAGVVRVTEGGLRWYAEDGEISAALQTAELSWRWREQTLDGDLQVLLADYGEVRGDFRLPLPAQVPIVFDMDAPLQATLTARVREQGLLATFMPGLVDETAGTLSARLTLGGSARHPDFGGEFSLSDAGAILPATGIVLRDFEVRGVLQGQQVRVTSLGVSSGPGRLEGTALVDLEDWQLKSFRAELSGRDVQAADLPELEIRVSPNLRIEGGPERLLVAGEVQVPLFVVTGWQDRTPVSPSADVVFVNGEEIEIQRPLPMALVLDLRLVLGDSVIIKLHGLDARLGGDLTLTTNERGDFLGNGEIRVIQGHYATYGLRLPITRGRLFFPGGPVERPTLDILALRTVGEVRAGVQVSGTPQAPVVRLYSEPGMPDTDILAYVVLGRPLGGGQGEIDAMMLAAGALLSQGESAAMQDRLQRRLGIDVIEVQSGDGDVQASMVTIGKYLTPDLYISFGQSLFGESNVARMRYSLTERWQIESQLGDISGADLFYRLEFR